MVRMNIQYIGNRDFLAEGKNLLELLSQLRDFGAGRMVTRGEWGRRHPHQPSYLRIRQVEPKMDRWLWHGRVWAEWTFRGRPLGLYEFAQELDRPDWHLIHRRQEAAFADLKGKEAWSPKPLPSRIPLPPLLRRLEATRQGKDVPSVPALHVFDPEHAPIQAPDDATMLKEAALSAVESEGVERGDIYDLDPSVYLDLYGEQLPTTVDEWTQHG